MRALILLLCLVMAPAWAVQPDEILEDPALESRARDLGKELRCLVCRNESIDDSNAELARDLRLLVRERLVAGDSDRDVIDYVVERYGEFVLLRPTGTGSNIALWSAGPAMLIVALSVSFLYLLRRGRARSRNSRLSDIEEARLREILEE